MEIFLTRHLEHGLVQAEQRSCQASLAEMEARYAEELQGLRAELSEVDARNRDEEQLRLEEATEAAPLVALSG